ncbi:unnamed protein product [Nesidiocoris tenuis]|uniref:Uncharacterized protein n=1 Tax=Nesidiocoris tenuis TaxID=355587 RepID=A0A6H5GLG3_9HEMI|nr:unnamed protein product [Nesidiocoris tenuis]
MSASCCISSFLIESIPCRSRPAWICCKASSCSSASCSNAGLLDRYGRAAAIFSPNAASWCFMSCSKDAILPIASYFGGWPANFRCPAGPYDLPVGGWRAACGSNNFRCSTSSEESASCDSVTTFSPL